MTDDFEKKLVGLAQAYVIDTLRPYHTIRDITRVPAIIELIEKDKSGELARENPMRRKPTWQQFVTEDMNEAAIIGRANKNGIYLTEEPEDMYICQDGLMHDKRVKLHEMSLPLPPRKGKPVREKINDILKRSGRAAAMTVSKDHAVQAGGKK